MNHLARLQKIAQLRERKAIRECQARQQQQFAAERAHLEAVAAVTQLQHRREEVLAQVWSTGAPVTGHEVMTAIQCAEHLAMQEKGAQREVQQAKTREAEAMARLTEARAVQAAALRASHKLDHAADIASSDDRRALERVMATRREDDAAAPLPVGGAW